MIRIFGRISLVVLVTAGLMVGGAFTAVAAQSIDKPAVAAKKAPRPKAWVKKVQMALNKQGYKLKEDGLWGKQTRAAVKDFQKKNGFKVNGRVDKATKAKLGI